MAHSGAAAACSPSSILAVCFRACAALSMDTTSVFALRCRAVQPLRVGEVPLIRSTGRPPAGFRPRVGRGLACCLRPLQTLIYQPGQTMSHFPSQLCNLPKFDGPFDAHKLVAEGCSVLFACIQRTLAFHFTRMRQTTSASSPRVNLS